MDPQNPRLFEKNPAVFPGSRVFRFKNPDFFEKSPAVSEKFAFGKGDFLKKKMDFRVPKCAGAGLRRHRKWSHFSSGAGLRREKKCARTTKHQLWGRKSTPRRRRGGKFLGFGSPKNQKSLRNFHVLGVPKSQNLEILRSKYPPPLPKQDFRGQNLPGGLRGGVFSTRVISS